MKLSERIHSVIAAPALLVWLWPMVLIVPNLWLGISELNSPLAKMVNILLPAGVYYLLMGLWRRSGLMTLLMLPLAILAAFQIVLLFLYGESIIAIDMFMNVVTTNVGEATELLGNLLPAIAVVIALYLPLLAVAVYQICIKAFATADLMRRARTTGGVAAAAGLVLMMLTYMTVDGYSARRELFPLNVCCNMVDAGVRTRQAMNYHKTSAGFSYSAVSSRPDSLRQVYVLVIGETSRADNWQLFGYDRHTNPRLSQRSDLLTYGRTMSESNTTHKSVPMLLSCLTADSFGDSVMCVHSLFDAFNGAGYHTAMITNQLPNHSYIDLYGRQAGNYVCITDAHYPRHDHELLDQLARQIEAAPDGPLLVGLHCYGSHHRYCERYPAEYRHFTPDGNGEATPGHRPELINAYDNSILYTDALLDSMIDMLDRLDCQAALIYTSDHGEDIFDDERHRFLHASPTPTYYQLHVPLLLWMSPEYQQAYPGAVAAAEAHRHLGVSSTRTVFDTLLSLAGVTSPYFRPEQALTEAAYREPPRRYLTDYNEGVALQESGFRQPDFERLDALDHPNLTAHFRSTALDR